MKKIDRTPLFNRISKDELLTYYREHTRRDTEKHFNITTSECCILFTYYNIFNIKQEERRKTIQSLTREEFIKEIFQLKDIDVAQKYGVTPSYVLKIKHKYNLEGKKQCELLYDMIGKESVEIFYNNHTFTQTWRHFNITPSQLKLFFKYYGIQVRTKDQDYKRRLATFLSHYGKEENPEGYKAKYNQYKDTMLQEYGADNPSKVKSIKDRAVHTLQEYKDNNKMHQSSKIEKKYLNYLQELFGQDDIVYQHFDAEIYPFNCDFYIKSIDFWIELNGWWHHGEYPYTKMCNKAKIKLDEAKEKYPAQFDSFVKVWTKSDPLKYKFAKKYYLNYFAVYDNGRCYNSNKLLIAVFKNLYSYKDVCNFIYENKEKIKEYGAEFYKHI